MKDGDGFVVANLLEAKLGSDALLQALQRRPLEPDGKVERRQQYCRPLKLGAALCTFINVHDLAVGKPIKIVKDE